MSAIWPGFLPALIWFVIGALFGGKLFTSLKGLAGKA